MVVQTTAHLNELICLGSLVGFKDRQPMLVARHKSVELFSEAVYPLIQLLPGIADKVVGLSYGCVTTGRG